MATPSPQSGRGPAAAPGRAERTRQRILEAAGQCFAASGFARTTVEQIAAAAGVSKPLVYHHFRGKEALLEAVLERTLADWAESVRIDEELAAGKGLLAAVAQRIRASLAYARENPVVRGVFQLDPELLLSVGRSAAVRASMEDFRASLTERIEEGIARGELRRGLDARRTADLIRLIQMALIDHVLHPEWIDVDDALVDDLVEMLSRGLALAPETLS